MTALAASQLKHQLQRVTTEPDRAEGLNCCHPWRMSKLLFLFLLLPLMPVKAEELNIQCPGLTTPEMRFCASQSLEKSNQALQEQLPQATLEKWKAATQEVCAAAYAPYRQGTIYPQMVVGCDDRLNRVLLEEFQGLGR